MPPRCQVCIHPQRDTIDLAIASGSVSLRRIASERGLSVEALRRHRDNHLPSRLALAVQAETLADAESLLAQLRALRLRADAITSQAEQERDWRVALSGIREMRAILETLMQAEAVRQERDHEFVHIRDVRLVLSHIFGEIDRGITDPDERKQIIRRLADIATAQLEITNGHQSH